MYSNGNTVQSPPGGYGYPYYGYPYAAGYPGYYYAPGFYAAPTVAFGFGTGWGYHGWGWHGGGWHGGWHGWH
jgi:hypothetical protein